MREKGWAIIFGDVREVWIRGSVGKLFKVFPTIADREEQEYKIPRSRIFKTKNGCIQNQILIYQHRINQLREQLDK